MDLSWLKELNNTQFIKQPLDIPKNIQWIKQLQVGDVIETDREPIVVVFDSDRLTKQRKRMVSVKVKRAHLKVPIYLKSCNEFDNCVEIVWGIHEGYKQCEFDKWIVKRNGVVINLEV